MYRTNEYEIMLQNLNERCRYHETSATWILNLLKVNSPLGSIKYPVDYSYAALTLCYRAKLLLLCVIEGIKSTRNLTDS